MPKHTLTFQSTEAAQEALNLLYEIDYQGRSMSTNGGQPQLSLRTREALDDAAQALMLKALHATSATFNQAEESLDTAPTTPGKPDAVITGSELEQYAEYTRLIHVGAAGERDSEGNYAEDGIEQVVDELDYKAATLGFHIACKSDGTNCRLVPMTGEEKAEFRRIDAENKAREAILRWARIYFSDHDSSEVPEVEVTDPVGRDGDIWTMQLWVPSSTEEGDPTVTFTINKEGHAWPSRIEYPNHATFFETAEVHCWHQERKTPDWTEYSLIIKDGQNKPIPLIVKYNATKNEVRSDVWVPPDMDYTVHDGCDHDGSKEGHGEYCVLEDPGSCEYQESELLQRYATALRNMETQLKERHIAESLRVDKARQLKAVEFDEVE